MFGKLAGYKTYNTAGLAIAAAGAGYLTGTETAAQALQLGATALLAAFLRSGIAASVTPPK